MKIVAKINRGDFAAVAAIAQMWISGEDPYCGTPLEYIGPMLDEDIAPTLEIDGNFVRLCTSSGLGVYTWTPTQFIFEGRRNSFLGGCLIAQCTMYIERLDIDMRAPIMPYGSERALHMECQVEAYHTSRPDVPLGGNTEVEAPA
jgi:hypothetical protein